MPGYLEGLADAVIAAAYFSIALTFLYLIRRRPDLQFNWRLACFTVFMVACGVAHMMGVWTFWPPIDGLSGAVKGVMALAAVASAILLVRLVPTAVHWPSPAALQRANASLEREIAARKRAEADVRRSNELLEIRVAERTQELETAYRSLRDTRQAGMQQERLHSLGRMARSIAHDINNALTPATLYTQSLLDHDRSLSPEAREDLRVIQQAIEEVTRTVGRIKDFYRGHDANAARVPIQVDLLLEQVIELTRSRWADMPQGQGVIELRKEFAAQVPPIVGVPGEICDALMNLVYNAVDSMPRGGTLTVRSYGTPYHVTVEIADTGVGMTEEVRTFCLDPFFTTKGTRGTGLGLATVYGMAERHRAVLEIDSEPGSGTVVRLVFPAAASTEQIAPVTNAPRRPATGLRILVVDDDQLLRQSMRAILEREGHRVCVAHGGRTAIDLFTAALRRGESFDAVITDLGMPNVDGRAVASTVKDLSPDTPVVLMTGWGEHLRDGDNLPSGVDQLLNKPAKLSELRGVLAELVPASAWRSGARGDPSMPLAAPGRD